MNILTKLIFLLALLSHAAYADTIKLKNGDVITGKVVKKETNKLIFETKYAGEIKVLWSEVATLSTDDAVNLVLKDDSNFNARLQKRSLGKVKAVNTGLQLSTELDMNQLAYINPSPEVSGKGVSWKGHANLGGAITQGNTDTSVIRFDAEAIARSKTNRFTIGGYVNRAENNDIDTEFNSKGYMQYDHFLSKQWYLYANGSLEHDRFRDIKLRSSAGVGSGYQIYEQDDLNLSVEGGLNYVNTDFNAAEDDSYASARWALKYDQLIFEHVKLFHRHEVLVSLEDAQNTLIFTQTGLRVPIAKNLNASTQLNVDYAGQPAEGRKSVDRSLLFSLGYNW